MYNWYQAAGDEALLRQQAAQTTDPDVKRGYDAALTLTPAEKDFAARTLQYHEERFKQAFDEGWMPEALENYIHQMWEAPEKAPPELVNAMNRMQAGDLAVNPAFLKPRLFTDTFMGEQLGYKAKHKDIAKRVWVYDRAFNKAMAGKALVKTLRTTPRSASCARMS